MLLHHPQSRAALNLPGLCPICGGSASRKVTCDAGMARETYRCAVDGEIEYAHGESAAIRVGGRSVSAAAHAYDAFQPLAVLVSA